MIDNEDINVVRYSDFNHVHCSQFKEFNCEQKLTPIQSRLYYLMVFGQQPRTENESLYGWTNRLGLPKSTTYGLFTKRNQNMHLAVAEKISEATGANIEWVQKGIGEPFVKEEAEESITAPSPVDYEYQSNTTDTVSGVALPVSNYKIEAPLNDKFPEQLEPHILDAALLQQAFETLVQALKATGRIMQPKGVSRFVATVYASLKENEDMDTAVLQDCILTLEEALKSTRRTMSPKAKTDLILVIYELYSGNASYKEAMTSTINQLIRSVSKNA